MSYALLIDCKNKELVGEERSASLTSWRIIIMPLLHAKHVGYISFDLPFQFANV